MQVRHGISKLGEKVVNIDEHWNQDERRKAVFPEKDFKEYLETLEEDFDKSISEISSQGVNDNLRKCFCEVMSLVKRAHSTERSLMAESSLVCGNIIYQTPDLQIKSMLAADKTSKADHKLKCEEAWRLASVSKEKEVSMLEEISQLDNDINNFLLNCERAKQFHNEKSKMLLSLRNTQEALEEENSDLLNQNQYLRTVLMGLLHTKDDAVASVDRAREALTAFVQELQERSHKFEEAVEIQQNLKRELQGFAQRMDHYSNLVEDLTEQNHLAGREKQELEMVCEDQSRTLMLMKANINALKLKNAEIASGIKDRTRTFSNAREGMLLYQGVMKEQLQRGKTQRDTLASLQKKKSKMEDKLRRLHRQQKEEECRYRALKQSKTESCQSRIKLKSSLYRERCTLKVMYTHKTLVERQLKNILTLEKCQSRHLASLDDRKAKDKLEIVVLKSLLREKKTILESMDVKVSKMFSCLLMLSRKTRNFDNILESKEREILQTKKEIGRTKACIGKIRQNMDVTTLDAELYRVSCKQAEVELSEVKENYNYMNQQLENVKDHLTRLDNRSQVVVKDMTAMMKKISRLKLDNENIKSSIDQLNTENLYLEQQNLGLMAVIRTADEDRSWVRMSQKENDILEQKLVKKIKASERELRDRYSALLTRQNDLQSTVTTLSKQSKEHDSLVNKIVETRDIKCSLNTKREEIQTDLKLLTSKDEQNLQNEIINRILEDNLDNKINIHKWRDLEARDPGSFQLLEVSMSLKRKQLFIKREIERSSALLRKKDGIYLALRRKSSKIRVEDTIQNITELREVLSGKSERLKKAETRVEALKKELSALQLKFRQTSSLLSKKKAGILLNHFRRQQVHLPGD